MAKQTPAPPKTEAELRAEFELPGILAYEQAIQSGLPEHTARTLGDLAQLEHAKAEIARILGMDLSKLF